MTKTSEIQSQTEQPEIHGTEREIQPEIHPGAVGVRSRPKRDCSRLYTIAF